MTVWSSLQILLGPLSFLFVKFLCMVHLGFVNLAKCLRAYFQFSVTG